MSTENQGQDLTQSTQAIELNLESVQSFINDNEDAKKWFNSEKDKFFSKSLESWKMKNLDQIIESEIAKRNPAKTEAEIRLETLQRKFEEMELKNKQAEIKAFAVKEASELNLPIELASFCIAETNESTLENLTTFKKALDQLVQEEVELRLKGKGKHVQSTAPTTQGLSGVTVQQNLTARDLFANYLNNQSN